MKMKMAMIKHKHISFKVICNGRKIVLEEKILIWKKKKNGISQ